MPGVANDLRFARVPNIQGNDMARPDTIPRSKLLLAEALMKKRLGNVEMKGAANVQGTWKLPKYRPNPRSGAILEQNSLHRNVGFD